jgi:histidinol-phosphatase (PHP family)
MNLYQNLHTHSRYDDGVDTLEEMIAAARGQGFTSLGFSGHSYMHYAPDHSMSIEGTEAYKREIRALQASLRGEFDVFCGLEFDMYSEVDLAGYDYLIGSVHYLLMDGKHVGFDRSAQVVASVINEYFHGDGMAYAKAYYETLCHLPEYGKFDIVGHFDLITKHSEQAHFFDEEDPAYRKAALEAAEALAGKIPFFEVNTGAISRGYRTTPYPSPFLLKEFRRLGFGAVISSDCHDSRYLGCAFEDAAELLRTAGFTERYLLTPNGFTAVAL